MHIKLYNHISYMIIYYFYNSEFIYIINKLLIIIIYRINYKLIENKYNYKTFGRKSRIIKTLLFYISKIL